MRYQFTCSDFDGHLFESHEGTKETLASIAHVALRNWGTQEYRGKQTSPLLSPQCMTIEKLSAHIERLKKELDIIHREAKEKFAKVQGKAEAQGDL